MGAGLAAEHADQRPDRCCWRRTARNCAGLADRRLRLAGRDVGGSAPCPSPAVRPRAPRRLRSPARRWRSPAWSAGLLEEHRCHDAQDGHDEGGGQHRAEDHVPLGGRSSLALDLFGNLREPAALRVAPLLLPWRVLHATAASANVDCRRRRAGRKAVASGPNDRKFMLSRSSSFPPAWPPSGCPASRWPTLPARR